MEQIAEAIDRQTRAHVAIGQALVQAVAVGSNVHHEDARIIIHGLEETLHGLIHQDDDSLSGTRDAESDDDEEES